MLLSKLELIGFKSFADKTEFVFEPGVTAFVGPNGCGKSNVVDAVKWVLGEQSAKALRGKEMVDLIYNGTNGHPSVGYAEASLTLLNNRGLLPVDYEEVCITRRIYRSGECEYFINRQPCRLKDIRELLMDTGIGCGAYSIIEQGQVDTLLKASPQERRIIFEEAAGIAKYKARKKEALARLERVSQNLIRVADIIQEVERQLRSVRLQARKAARYKEYSSRLRELRLKISLREFLDLRAEKSKVEGELAVLTDEEQSLRAELSQLESRGTQIEVRSVENEKALTALAGEGKELEKKVATTEQRIADDERRVGELMEAEKTHREAAAAMRERIEAARRQQATLREELAALDETIKKTSSEVSERLARIASLEEECSCLSENIEQLKAKVFDLLQERSSLRNELVAISTESATLQARATRIRQKQREISEIIAALNEECRNYSFEMWLLAICAHDLEQHLQSVRDRHSFSTRQLQQLRSKLSETKLELTQLESRKKTLEELIARAEGVNAGVKAVIGASGEALQGVRGMLADMIQVDFRYALAIEAALGEAAQNVVTETTADALNAMKFLREKEAGRARFLPLDRVKGNGDGAQIPENEQGVVGWAIDLVHETANPAVRNFLRNTLVVETLDKAIELSSNGCAGLRIVTLDGEVVEPDGSICGGSRMKGGIITRRSELAHLQHRIAECNRTLDNLRNAISERDSEVAQLAEKMEWLREQLDDLKLRRASLNDKKKALDDRLNLLRQEAEVNNADLAELEETFRQNTECAEAIRKQIDSLDAQRTAMEREVAEKNSSLDAMRKEHRNLTEQATALKVVLAQNREKREAVARAIAELDEDIAEREESAAARESEAERCRSRAEECRNAVRENRNLLQNLVIKLSQVRERIEALSRERDELRARQLEIQDSLKMVRRKLDELTDALNQSRLKHTECEVKLNNLLENARRQYEADLAALQPPEDFDSTDWGAVNAEIEELQRKIQRLGNVNLDALEEQKELEERASFLQAQKEDLETSRHNLLLAIRRINRQSREMFMKTFNDVREYFRETFRKLFGGGRADIMLEEGVDVLEAGIEIVACPPGKAPRSLSLLSGGEKTLTTVALLFAIFRAKPSPFCILDEVDAALDESNIDRFVSLLREFLDQSQFVIITHNKRTLGIADVLYGITMQESGVSKKVAVKFEKRELERVDTNAAAS